MYSTETSLFAGKNYVTCSNSLAYTGPTIIIIIEVDDTISTEPNIKKLKSELTKSKWGTKTVQEFLKATFTARRKAMLKVDARNRIE